MHYPAVWHSHFLSFISNEFSRPRAAINYWIGTKLGKLIACNDLHGEGS